MVTDRRHHKTGNVWEDNISLSTGKTLPQKSSIVWEDDLQRLAVEWFKKNPGWTISQVANQAVRKFMTSPFTTEPVELAIISKQEGDKMMDKMMAKHADALERLK
ncbi:MAG: hypothetical protein V4591_04435 [Bdellovibrionota bacterium]